MGVDLSNAVIAADERAQYDTYVKILLARKSILSRILTAAVDEFRGMRPAEVEQFIEGEVHIGNVPVSPGMTNQEQTVGGDRIVGLNTIQAEMREGMAIFDIVFYVRMRDGLSQIIINVEAQKDEPTGYDLLNRAIFYVSRLISSQSERDFTKRHYNDLKRVYSIWICMNMNECVWNHIHLTNDTIMGDYTWRGKMDLMNIILLGLPNNLPEQGEKFELHRMLSALLSSDLSAKERLHILENEYNIEMGTEFRKELDTMCNLSQGVFEKGIEQGKVNAILDNIKNLMKNVGYTAEQAMQALGIPASEQKFYMTQL